MITTHRSGNIEFSFDPEQHLYTVPGHYCLATSDVISLCGLSDYGQVPLNNLEKARWRGTELHKAIHYWEENDLDIDDVDEEIRPCFDRYLEWKEQTGFIPIGPFEHPIVYEHLDMMIGCHLDLRGYIPGKGLYVLDAKTTHPNSGAAKKQTHLRWAMQLQSYVEATHDDEAFWAAAEPYERDSWNDMGAIALRRAILHLHPKAKDVFIEFPADDSAGWSACVQLASMKIANGYKRER